MECVARIRPLLEREKLDLPCISVEGKNVSVSNLDDPTAMSQMAKTFRMNDVLNNVDQATLFEKCVPYLTASLDGYNASIFAYGQTGTGKTHSSLGYDLWSLAKGDPTLTAMYNMSSSFTSPISSPSSTFDSIAEGSVGRGSTLGSTDKENMISSKSITSSPRKVPSFLEVTNLLEQHKDDAGIIPRSMQWLFDKRDQLLDSAIADVKLAISLVEILNEDMVDLLDPDWKKNSSKKDVYFGSAVSPSNQDQSMESYANGSGYRSPITKKEKTSLNDFHVTKKLDPQLSAHGEVVVNSLTEIEVSDMPEVMKALWIGAKRRSIEATDMNYYSSRSHTIFMVKIQKEHLDHTSNRSSKILFVDLAGSEKATGKYDLSPDRIKEMANINKSLSCLGNVINALVDNNKKSKTSPAKSSNKSPRGGGGNSHGFGENHSTSTSTTSGLKHVPYRSSKLTRYVPPRPFLPSAISLSFFFFFFVFVLLLQHAYTTNANFSIVCAFWVSPPGTISSSFLYTATTNLLHSFILYIPDLCKIVLVKSRRLCLYVLYHLPRNPLVKQ